MILILLGIYLLTFVITLGTIVYLVSAENNITKRDFVEMCLFSAIPIFNLWLLVCTIYVCNMYVCNRDRDSNIVVIKSRKKND